MIALGFAELVSSSQLSSISSSSTRRKLEDETTCKHESVEPLVFTVVENDATGLAVEDDITNHLAKFGIKVETKLLSKEKWNAAQEAGDFHLSFTETWGAPYDPHSYALGWIDGSGGEGHMQAFSNFEEPASSKELFEMIHKVTEEEDRKARAAKWEEIHNYYHSQAVMLPLWGKRIPTLMNSRLTGFQAGHQQFDYPVHKLVPITGSSTVTIAPGAQTGLFQSVGRLDPHTYRPNEFFANNWVYEGLVAYGEGGQVLPALATSWTITDNEYEPGEQYVFTLREGVKFHDGTEWNCEAAKLNFDHVFAGELATSDWHGWYGVPLYINKWQCNDDYTFIVSTHTKYTPFLQELSYIRPLRMLSPAAFVNGNTTDPITHNSCHKGWETKDVVCAGITQISGTGPYVFTSRKTETIDDAEVDAEVVFTANSDYWGVVPAVETLKIVRYDSSEDAKAALLDERLDVIWGAGVLPDKDIAAIQDDDEYQGKIQVFHSKDIQNVMLLLNSGKAPLDDINVRKTVIHAIDKASIVEKELAGLQKVVDNVFPLDAPNCEFDLTPRWDFDSEKASLLYCDQGSSSSLAIGLGIGLGALFVVALGVAVSATNKRKEVEAELDLLRKNNNAEEA